MKTIFKFLFLQFISTGMMLAQMPLAIPDTIAGPVINLNMAPSSVTFYTTPTQTLGFNGDFLGPTLLLDQGDSVEINVLNQIGETTTVHWHGLHVSPENDGGPHSVIQSGATWTKSIEVMDMAGTYWYHPHLHMHTNEHVTKGLAGFIYVRDPAEAALALPRSYGVDDFPILVQSRDFDANDQFLVGTAMDTALMVNGTLDPSLALPAQVVRLRLLNGSSERVYNFGFSDGRSFAVIASDGGLLSAPVSLSRLRLAPGERAEILLDLQTSLGQNFILKSYGSELPNAIYGAGQPGMGPGQTIPGYSSNPLNGSDFDVLGIQVQAATPGAILSIPGNLVAQSPWLETNADTTRTLTFTPQTMGMNAIQGPFFINGSTFDMNVINQTIPLGNIEVWELRNQSPIAHPFHIHDVQFYVLDKNGQAPPLQERGRKDVVLVEAMSTVRFITRFEDFSSDTMPYMYHCHMLTHEDDGMMQQFLVVDTLATGLPESAVGVPRLNLYPNPGTSPMLRIELGSSFTDGGLLRIMDMRGKAVLETEIAVGTASFEVNVSALSVGQYLVQMRGPSAFAVAKWAKLR